MRGLWTLFLALFGPQICVADEATVSTNSGMIYGLVERSPSSHTVIESYLGVPYGRPPVGPLRFRPPQPVEPWSEPKTFQTLAKSCFHTPDQMFPGFEGAEMWNSQTTLTEDCLNMNIWVPRNQHDGTVLVWIFGGGFFSGSPSLPLYDGRELAAQGKAIVVNINYRLGPFGFLFLGDNTSVPGNMGLLDQQLALRWIHDNIGFFGGKKESVTLFGESAGSASVASHLFSPGSWKLFKNVILQSGTVLNPWATATQRTMIDRSMSLAKKVDCGFSDMEAVAKCLRNVDYRIIQGKADEVTGGEVRVMEFPFVPVRKDVNFFKGDAHELLNEGKVKNCSVLVGTNRDEGSYWLPYILPDHGFKFYPGYESDNEKNQALITWRQYLDAVNATFKGYFSSALIFKAIAHQYSDQYATTPQLIGDGRKSEALRDGVSKFVADFFFTCDVLRFTDELRKIGNPVYSYFFTQRSSANKWPLWMGVMHGYEIEYIFGAPSTMPHEYASKERIFSTKMIEYWTTFAREGQPNPEWPLYGEEKAYVVLRASPAGGEDTLFQSRNLNGANCAFWKETSAFLNRSDECVNGSEHAKSVPSREFNLWLCCTFLIHLILATFHTNY